MKVLFLSSRSASVLLDPSGDYRLRAPLSVSLNGQPLPVQQRSVCSLYHLKPDTDYLLSAWRDGEEAEQIAFRTLKESVSLDVRRFGAVGDGIHDDTAALQAAILSCPRDGRVRVPAGTYLTGPLFLKSHMTLELQYNAVLALHTDRSRFPILPGTTFTEDGEFLLGSWEGNPLDCFASALTGLEVEDVRIIGEGVIDGQAQKGDWWVQPKERRGAYRGRLLYLRGCSNVAVQGITFRNSPAWNLHPTFSENLLFCDIAVEAPANSPNTDGFDPESCSHVRVYGARFSVGDDCIAIKSGKIYMGSHYKTPCQDLEIAWSAMLDGHGGVTIGSEMAGGVQDVHVHHCWMRGNDRGLRVKTRRGRGEQGVIDRICFSDVRMEGVKTPLVINSMYFCDPDGHSDFVQSRDPHPVDSTTPAIGEIVYERVLATDCQTCVAYLLGLPEQPIRKVSLLDCQFSFSPDAQPSVPAMAEGVPAISRQGIIAHFVSLLRQEQVEIIGLDPSAAVHPDG